MKGLIKTIDGLPLIVKIILALPALDIVWNVYRLLKSLVKGNILGIILSILLLTIGIAFMWIVDIICLLLSGKVWWID